MKHTLGIEVSTDLEKVNVWGFCPHTEDERLEGVGCSVLARVDLPPEPLPRPYKDGGVWRIPCGSCHGSGRTTTSVGYKRRIRCPICAGRGHGQRVTSTYPWFRWAALPRFVPTADCIVEMAPKRFAEVCGDPPSVKRLPSGKVVLMIEFDYVPDRTEMEAFTGEAIIEFRVPNVDSGPLSEAEWSSLLGE